MNERKLAAWVHMLIVLLILGCVFVLLLAGTMLAVHITFSALMECLSWTEIPR